MAEKLHIVALAVQARSDEVEKRVKILSKSQELQKFLLDNLEELVHIGDHFKTMHLIRDVLDDIPAVLINNELGQRFINGLSFDFFNSKSNLDCLLIENENRFLGVGKAVEGKIKPLRIFKSLAKLEPISRNWEKHVFPKSDFGFKL